MDSENEKVDPRSITAENLDIRKAGMLETLKALFVGQNAEPEPRGPGDPPREIDLLQLQGIPATQLPLEYKLDEKSQEIRESFTGPENAKKLVALYNVSRQDEVKRAKQEGITIREARQEIAEAGAIVSALRRLDKIDKLRAARDRSNAAIKRVLEFREKEKAEKEEYKAKVAAEFDKVTHNIGPGTRPALGPAKPL